MSAGPESSHAPFGDRSVRESRGASEWILAAANPDKSAGATSVPRSDLRMQTAQLVRSGTLAPLELAAPAGSATLPLESLSRMDVSGGGSDSTVRASKLRQVSGGALAEVKDPERLLASIIDTADKLVAEANSVKRRDIFVGAVDQFRQENPGVRNVGAFTQLLNGAFGSNRASPGLSVESGSDGTILLHDRRNVSLVNPGGVAASSFLGTGSAAEDSAQRPIYDAALQLAAVRNQWAVQLPPDQLGSTLDELEAVMHGLAKQGLQNVGLPPYLKPPDGMSRQEQVNSLTARFPQQLQKGKPELADDLVQVGNELALAQPGNMQSIFSTALDRLRAQSPQVDAVALGQMIALAASNSVSSSAFGAGSREFSMSAASNENVIYLRARRFTTLDNRQGIVAVGFSGDQSSAPKRLAFDAAIKLTGSMQAASIVSRSQPRADSAIDQVISLASRLP